ncbi:hypothetical protein EVAR_82118_1 [Eumeta japonica]|uniref:Uncharacterized protein n=1 Tax=Eumeta variegata TaxID=151549 RepID=A0A4C1U1L7_EUMVA|nr:hypothetical protein EVAR_82118_1 [Eumeta japonica]
MLSPYSYRGWTPRLTNAAREYVADEPPAPGAEAAPHRIFKANFFKFKTTKSRTWRDLAREGDALRPPRHVPSPRRRERGGVRARVVVVRHQASKGLEYFSQEASPTLKSQLTSAHVSQINTTVPTLKNAGSDCCDFGSKADLHACAITAAGKPAFDIISVIPEWPS